MRSMHQTRRQRPAGSLLRRQRSATLLPRELHSSMEAMSPHAWLNRNGVSHTYTPHVTRHTLHVTRHTSRVTRYMSHVTRYMSHVTRHLRHGCELETADDDAGPVIEELPDPDLRHVVIDMRSTGTQTGAKTANGCFWSVIQFRSIETRHPPLLGCRAAAAFLRAALLLVSQSVHYFN